MKSGSVRKKESSSPKTASVEKGRATKAIKKKNSVKRKQTSLLDQEENELAERTKALGKAHEELKLTEEKFNKLFHLSPFGITLAEIPSGKIADVNEHYLEIVGYSREEIIGRTSADLKIVDKEVRDRIVQDIEEGGFVKNVEVEVRTKSGEKMPVMVSSEIITIGNKKYFLNAVTDIIERKKAEEILAEKNLELEKANKELSSFAYIASHDLQEPLRKIQAFGSRLFDKDNEHLSDVGKDSLRRMQDAARRMQTLIDDLLAYSRTATTERKFVKANIKDIIDEVKMEMKEQLDDNKATVEVSSLRELNVIPFQFRQVISNLIGNSLKFAKPDMPPRIIITNSMVNGSDLKEFNLDPKKKYCHISFADNGIGFEPEYNKRIFDVFQRLHGRSEYPGTGIGLAICKKIVENHFGIITAEGKPGEGATFHIYLPV